MSTSGSMDMSIINYRYTKAWKSMKQLLKGTLVSSIYELCHGQKSLKIFVVVIPKEGLAGWGAANHSLGVTPTTEYNL